MKNYKVFVYGTLKRGYRNHYLLEGKEGKPAYAIGMDMYEGPGFPFAKEGGGIIKGELYEVERNTLERLDRLEGHPFFYRRKIKEVVCDGKKQKAYVYLYDKVHTERKIPSGEWM